ncbi:MAG TPA: ABC transporter ATP-binding protein [Vicinamibacterales bacterium]|nr:ABC transporter ATP-binding protein [Vicinamibacterales bacterium]
MGDLRAIFGWIDSRLRLRWALLIPVVAVAALLEAIGAIAVFGLLRLVVEPDRVRSTPGVSDLWLAWPTDDPSAIIGVLIALVGFFYVLRAAFLIWAEWFKDSTVARSGAQAAERLFARYLAADYLFHLKRRSASPIQEVSRSTAVAFQLVAASVLHFIAELATMSALIAVLAVTAPAATLIAVGLVLTVVAIPLVTTRRVWHRWGERMKQLEERQLHILQQSLGAVKEVKIAGREAYFEGRLRAVRRDLASVEGGRSALATAQRLGVETALIVGMLAVLWFITRGGASGADTVSLMGLFAYAGFRVVPSANRIMLNAGHWRTGRAFSKNAIADFKALRRVQLRPHGPEPVVAFNEALVCEDVTFTYDEGTAPAVSRVHLRLRAGESLGIVGATGSGKSTLVALLLGLLQPTSGRILLDGVPLTGLERAWQRLIGYVPQDTYLLDDTLRRNIAFGVPDALIDEQRVARSCTLAQLDDLIRQLPQGMDTPLGEDGARLSGGQRQRVAIARALYSDPAVLVFDEATAALDNQTEREVTRAIASLHGTRTLIVIAHRLTTVEACDRLIFLQDGRIAASGTYDELLRNAAFRGMAAH